MQGKHRVIVQNNRVHYDFEIKRNITILQGDSATGKTTLVEMIAQYFNMGASSGVKVTCDVTCRALSGNDWKLIIDNTHGNIIFIDEENSFINSKDFARTVRSSDNYFVLITRENLHELPYSVEEIYGIKTSGKYLNASRVYQEMYNIYSIEQVYPVRPEVVITEDSKAGYQFFAAICDGCDIECECAGGKSRIHDKIKEYQNKEVCVVADGAAIGSEMNRLYEEVKRKENLKLYLPESFEWLILKSGLIDGNRVKDILDHPEDFIRAEEYFSWERYFEKLLVNETEGTILQYSKKDLNGIYLHEKNRNAVLKVLADGNIVLEEKIVGLSDNSYTGTGDGND